MNYSIIKTKNNKSLYLASRPEEKELVEFIKFIKQKNIKTVVVLLPYISMMEIYGFSLVDYYKRNNIDVLFYPIQDFDSPSRLEYFHSLMKLIWKRINRGNVLIHCSAGEGRTGMVAAGLAIYKGKNVEDAISLIRKYRSGAVETPKQFDFLESYYKMINNIQEALLSGDIIGVPAGEAYKIDWKSGGGPETDLGKRRLAKLKKNKKDAIIKRVINKVSKL